MRNQGYRNALIISRRFTLLKLLLEKPIKQKVVVAFCRSLATMVLVGMVVIDAIEILAAQETNKRFSRILHNIRSEIKAGASFSQAISTHTKVFDSFFIALVNAGESSGNLAEALRRIAAQLEKSERLTKK